MISRIEGELLSVQGGRIELRCGAVVYELQVPAFERQRLSGLVGRTLEFHTLHYLESPNQGASFLPRLIGFATPEERSFFEVFTTVKGIGNRKALRALELPLPTVAAAIARRDVDLLTSLPEIGKRTAATIVAELQEKVDQFIEAKWPTPGRTHAAGGVDGRPLDDAAAALVHDALTVLAQLGEPRITARQLIDRALAADRTISTPDALVAAVYRLRETA
jgi:Holliday junction DNA helicase RuvA